MRFSRSLLLTLSLCALPQFALADSLSATHSITMTGHGEAEAVPDAAELSAGVRVQSPTAEAALAQANGRMESVLAALHKMGVAEKAIQTRDFSVAPQYAAGNGEALRLTGYQVQNEVEIRLDDVGKLGAILDALVTAGANEINGVRFSLRDPAPLLAEARAKAVADARAKAQTYAQAAGVALGPLLSLSESENQPPRPPFAQVRASVPIVPGEQSMAADVTMVWEIK